MKLKFNHLTMALATVAALSACQPQNNGIRLEHQGDTLTSSSPFRNRVPRVR